MPGEPHVLSGSSDASLLDGLHALLDELWQESPEVPAAHRMAFTTAVAEVAANVVEHAGAHGPVEARVVVQLRADGLEAVLEDRGAAYEPGAPDGEQDPLAETGRGLVMARALCEVVEYARVGDLNRWRLVRSTRG